MALKKIDDLRLESNKKFNDTFSISCYDVVISLNVGGHFFDFRESRLSVVRLG